METWDKLISFIPALPTSTFFLPAHSSLQNLSSNSYFSLPKLFPFNNYFLTTPTYFQHLLASNTFFVSTHPSFQQVLHYKIIHPTPFVLPTAISYQHLLTPNTFFLPTPTFQQILPSSIFILSYAKHV